MSRSVQFQSVLLATASLPISVVGCASTGSGEDVSRDADPPSDGGTLPQAVAGRSLEECARRIVGYAE